VGSQHFREAPGNYHGFSTSISMADGHSETYKLKNGLLRKPVTKATPAPGWINLGGDDDDYNWFNDRMPYH
jgi:hypothetical protein